MNKKKLLFKILQKPVITVFNFSIIKNNFIPNNSKKISLIISKNFNV